MNAFSLKDNRKDVIANGYWVSLVVLVTTMAMPIINFVASVIYYFCRRKSTYPVRWHAMNILVTQLLLSIVNSFVWYSLWQLMWNEWSFSDGLAAFYVLAGLLNLGVVVFCVVCCIRAKRGKEVDCLLVSPLSHLLCPKVSWDKWERKWLPAYSYYMEMAEQSKSRVLRDSLVVVGTAVAFVMALSVLLSKKDFEYPDFCLYDVIEKAVYDTNVKGQELADETAKEYLRTCVNYLCEKNGMDSVTVYLVKSSDINAYAYCGRNMIVNAGLVAACDKENELLSVIGHELAHLECNHVTESLKKRVGVSLILSFFFHNYSSLVTDPTMAKMSRKDEREADALSVVYLYKADIDPEGFPSFMRKILNGNWTDRIAFFSDHPATQKRIDDSMEQLNRLAPKNYVTVLSEEDWDVFKDKAALAKMSVPASTESVEMGEEELPE